MEHHGMQHEGMEHHGTDDDPSGVRGRSTQLTRHPEAMSTARPTASSGKTTWWPSTG